MKKKEVKCSPNWGELLKYLIMLKAIGIIILVSALNVGAGTVGVYSQTVKMNLQLQNADLEEVIWMIKKQSEFNFFYNTEDIMNVKGLDVNLKNATAEEILSECLESTDLTYSIIHKAIIIKKIEQTAAKLPWDINVEQKKSISGTVTNSLGEPIPGVSVVIKGTTIGIVTNIDGKYNLTAPGNTEALVFSFVGMKTAEITYTGQSILNVTLEEETVGIDEVVAIGYGSKKKRDIIGSIATVGGEDLTQTPSSSFTDLLQGRAAGMQVTSTSGAPGSTVNINVRGIHSINSESNPLWVIDGMPVFGNSSVGYDDKSTVGQNILATMNPNDIESIEVLKDAAATAIYGSRGSNGVIIVTTKTGKANEKGSVQVDYSTGISHLTKSPESMNFVNTTEWFQIADMSLAHTNNTSLTFDVASSLDPIFYKKTITREEAESTNTNWFDYILRTGAYKDLNVAFKQGFDKGAIFTSFGYRDDKSVSVGNDMSRLSARINADYQALKNLKLEARLNFSYTNNYRVKSQSHRFLGGSDGSIGGFGEVTRNGLPWLLVYDENDPTGYWNPGAGNYAMASDRDYILDQKQNYRGLGGANLEYGLPWVSGLSFRTGFDFDVLQDNTKVWTSALISNDGVSYSRANVQTYISYNYNAYFKYNRTFKQHHNITATLGTESHKTLRNITDVVGRNLVGTNQEIGSSSPATMVSMISYTTGERYIRSFFARADYKFRDKYLLGLSARRDGSSVFDSDYRWGNFYSLSAGWIISDENFFTNMKDVFSLLKLRGSFGQTGNQSIPNDQNLITIGYNSAKRYGPRGDSPAGVVYSVGNVGITWETTGSYDFGIDFGLLNNRLSGSVAYYMQDVSDMLLRVSVPPSSAIGSIYGNVGDMKNWGYEFNITSTNIERKDFSWSTDFNISTNKNEIKKLTPQMEALKGSTTYVGGALGLQQACDYAGVDPERGVHMIWEYDKDIYNETGEYLRTGRKIPFTESNSLLSYNQRVQSDKSIYPTFFGGFNNTFKYKGFELNAFFTFSGGNYIYNASEYEWTTAGSLNRLWKKDMLTQSWKPEWTDEQKQNAKYPLIVRGGPYYTAWNSAAIDPNTGRAGWWTNPDINNPVNPTATESYDPPLLSSTPRLSKYLEKGDYLRLKTLSFAYYIPRKAAAKLGLSTAKIYVSGTNLWTLTGYSGFDPEGQQSSATSTDSEFLPSVKMYSFGVNLNF